jgi:ABC-type sugar transport system ATPase subunit
MLEHSSGGGNGLPPALTMTGITKSFAGVQALKGVDLALAGGEVHALLGENGAGKSTLMKIMFGIQQPDRGRIELDAVGPVKIDGPRSALAMGIGLVSQELSLVPQLDVAQNIFLGRTRGLGIVPRGAYREEARRIVASLAPHLDVSRPVSDLGMADRQLVEICRTLSRGGRIIAFDEPTSSLTPNERDSLFAVIRQLKESGNSIVYISHRMKEIREICDRVTILRDGLVVATGPIADYSEERLNELIAGRELSRDLRQRHSRRAGAEGKPLLEVRNVSTERVKTIALSIEPGEVFGLVGLVGAGRSAILRAIFGLDPILSGEILVDGQPVRIASPRTAMESGVALIPEDRRGQAIVPMMSVEQNFGLGNHQRFSRLGFLGLQQRREAIEKHVQEMRIRPADIRAEMRNLSGGNQQKVVIARWLATGAHVFLFDEPTRGVDVGAKAEIHALIRGLSDEGVAVLLVSSELPEVLALADRIGVVAGGRLTRVLRSDDALTEETLMKLAS